MIPSSDTISGPLIRLLFLGDPRYDRRIQNFSNFFADHGWCVEILAGVAKGVVLPSGYKAIPLGYSSGPERFLSYHRTLVNELRRLPKADILFACDLYSLRAATVVKKVSPQTKVFYDAREIYTQLPTVAQKTITKRFWKWWEQHGMLDTDLVITTGPDDANAILQVHSFLPRSIVVKNMPARIEETGTTRSLHDHFSIAEKKKILVYVGGLQYGRGLEKTISTMTDLRTEASLVLIGDGVIKKALQEQVEQSNLSDTVFFFGPAPTDDVLPLLRSADAGISLIERISGSYDLALPSKIFEYFHAGLPTVSSPLGQVKECFGEREYLVYVNENDPVAISQAFKKILTISSNSKLREAIAVTANQEFVFENDAEKLLKIL